MTSLLATMFLLAAVATPTGGSAPYDADFKCGARVGGADMLDWVALLDLELLEGDLKDNEEQLAPLRNQIDLVEFACWEWLEAHYGVQVRYGALFILTKEWLERTRQDRVAALEAVVSAQDRHWEKTGEYAARVEDLPDFGVLSDYGLPDHLQLEVGRTSGGWQARLEPDEDWFRPRPYPVEAVYRCFAFAGEVPAGWEAMRRDGQPGPSEREPECFEPRTLVQSMSNGW